MTNGGFVTGVISDRDVKKIVRKNGFIHKLTNNIYSSISSLHICYYL